MTEHRCKECNTPVSESRANRSPVCARCYELPAVRIKYKNLRLAKRRDLSLDPADVPTGRTPKPTTARPGTEEKIRVLEERFANRLPLFVKGDVTGHSIVGGSGGELEEPGAEGG
jgi:hypothetical protein